MQISSAWTPSPADIERSHLKKFMNRHGIGTFAELLARAESDVEWFTAAVLEHLDIRFTHPYERVADFSRGPAWPQWCVGGRMNIASNCVDKHRDGEAGERVAIVHENEAGEARCLTYAQLADAVDRSVNMLRAHGLGKGDRIALFLPMTPDAVIALLATAKIGGIALPLFSGYGPSSVASRLADAEACALFTCDAFLRRGRLVPLKSAADEAVNEMPAIRRVFVARNAGPAPYMRPGRDFWWDTEAEKAGSRAVAEDTSAEDPLMIIYTSGTTGKPKGALHTHCGFPVKAAQDMAFGTDVHASDRLHWITDLGWMMGPWAIFGATILGASLFLYEGAPDHPRPDRIWELTARHRVTTLGVSPTFIRLCSKAGDELVKRHDLSCIRAFASTGEPWNEAPWLWLFHAAGGGTKPIINYSGGTEISGGILMNNPLLPIVPCAFSAPCPGIAADVMDENGKPVRGAVGELVIRQPWIGMTRGFWRDPERYEQTYWSRWPGIWQHGDWARLDEDGQWQILGRSDDTIKIAGKRVGPAEMESVLVSHPAVAEAAAIAVPDSVKGNAAVCFCVLKPGAEAAPELQTELLDLVAANCGKPLRPRAILFVPQLPKTRNGKVVRRAIRSAYLGEDRGDLSSLENLAALDAIPAQINS